MSKVHAHQESADLRELDASGGWYRTENDLQIFFQQVVGYRACWLYEVLCRLIPLAQKRLAEGERLDLTEKYMSLQSGISKSQVQREMKTLVAVGMVRKFQPSNKRCATYQLVRLQTLRDLGLETIKARLGNPDRVSADEVDGADLDEEQGENTLESRANRDDSREGGESAPPHAVEAPAHDAGYENPVRVTGPDVLAVPVFDANCTDSGSPVTQNPGVGDPGEGLLIKHKDIRQKDIPPTPASGGVVSELPFEDAMHGDGNFDDEAGIAAQWVMGKCDLSLNSRLKRVIAAALGRRAAKSSRCGLHDAAQFAMKNFWDYHQALEQGLLRFGPWSAKKFFENPYWENPGTWPWDQAKLAAQGRAAVGTRAVSEPATDGKFATENVVTHLHGRAAAVELAGCDARFANKLRELAMTVATAKLEDLDQELQAIEDEIVAELRDAALNYELGVLEAAADVELSKYRGRMSKDQLAKARAQFVDRELMKQRGVPRLSLFYMPHGT